MEAAWMEGERMNYSKESGQAGESGGQQSDMRNVQNLEAIINEGLRVALMEETPDQSLQVLLKYLGKALNGERTYIFEQNESGGDDNTYEWVADGVEPEKENLQNVPGEVCAGWYQNFSVGRHIVIEDLEEIRETDPLPYENLKRQGVHALVVVPLYDGKSLIGFYGVDNPPVKSLEYATNMLQTAAYFIVSSLKRRNLVRELQKRSYKVLHALSVDYLGIYEVNLDTGECETYRDTERNGMDWAVHFKDGYEAAMEWYISRYVVSRDQERLRAVTKKDYVLAQLKTKKKFYVRYQVKDSSCGLKYLELHFSATEKTEEEHWAIFAQRDVNAVVEQEEKYKLEARQSLEDILEGARTGIWTIELEEGRPPRMYADRTMRLLLGVPDEIGPEACYEHWFANIEPDYADMVQEAVQEILETGRCEVIYPWNHPELGKIYVRCGGVPDRTFRKPGACLNGYHQDITDTMVTRKKQEQAIMELLEKVRRANSAKSEFLSHMSHDLRTPINGILGMLAVMEKSGDDPGRQRECRKKIRVSTEHLLSLVNDVLQVSKLESGRPAAVVEPFSLQEVLESCVAVLSAQAEAKGIRLVLKEMDVQHDRLIGSPMYLKQILINVMDNALKYNRPHGSGLPGPPPPHGIPSRYNPDSFPRSAFRLRSVRSQRSLFRSRHTPLRSPDLPSGPAFRRSPALSPHGPKGLLSPPAFLHIRPSGPRIRSGSPSIMLFCFFFSYRPLLFFFLLYYSIRIPRGKNGVFLNIFILFTVYNRTSFISTGLRRHPYLFPSLAIISRENRSRP